MLSYIATRIKDQEVRKTIDFYLELWNPEFLVMRLFAVCPLSYNKCEAAVQNIKKGNGCDNSSRREEINLVQELHLAPTCEEVYIWLHSYSKMTGNPHKIRHLDVPDKIKLTAK
ncbi:hypothetical protein BS78_01G129100 [Paspalum vaginatum]|nr:hypothetical protein BS78_01G129100 [Paspalum vaginatum]